jgi:hypothetical protein
MAGAFPIASFASVSDIDRLHIDFKYRDEKIDMQPPFKPSMSIWQESPYSAASVRERAAGRRPRVAAERLR